MNLRLKIASFVIALNLTIFVGCGSFLHVDCFKQSVFITSSKILYEVVTYLPSDTGTKFKISPSFRLEHYERTGICKPLFIWRSANNKLLQRRSGKAWTQKKSTFLVTPSSCNSRSMKLLKILLQMISCRWISTKRTDKFRSLKQKRSWEFNLKTVQWSPCLIKVKSGEEFDWR